MNEQIIPAGAQVISGQPSVDYNIFIQELTTMTKKFDLFLMGYEEIRDATDFKDAYVKFRRAIKTLQNENLLYQREKHVIIDEEDGVVYASQPADSEIEQPPAKNDLEKTAP